MGLNFAVYYGPLHWNLDFWMGSSITDGMLVQVSCNLYLVRLLSELNLHFWVAQRVSVEAGAGF